MTNSWGPGDPPGGPYQQPQYYQPSAYPPPPPPHGQFMGKPAAITWFTVYSIALAVLYALIAILFVFMLVSPDTFAVEGEDSPAELRVQAIVMAIVCFPLAILFAISPLLPRRPWVWIYDLVLICLGLTSCCLWPATIPLLIFWIKPEARAWFGRSV